jgi:hypothetical protein
MARHPSWPAALVLAALSVLALARCSNGETGAGGAGGSGSGGTGGAGGAGGAGGGPDVEACGTCADVFTNGGVACDGAPSDALSALEACACDGPCASACGASLCTSAPSDPTCGACLEMSCAAQSAACAAD